MARTGWLFLCRVDLRHRIIGGELLDLFLRQPGVFALLDLILVLPPRLDDTQPMLEPVLEPAVQEQESGIIDGENVVGVVRFLQRAGVVFGVPPFDLHHALAARKHPHHRRHDLEDLVANFRHDKLGLARLFVPEGFALVILGRFLAIRAQVLIVVVQRLLRETLDECLRLLVYQFLALFLVAVRLVGSHGYPPSPFVVVCAANLVRTLQAPRRHMPGTPRP